MAKRSEVFKSGKYLKASDLQGKPITVTIERAPWETMKGRDGGEDESKIVLYFEGAKKGLPLNVTNWDSCVEICDADDSDLWIGCKVELYPTTAQLKNQTVDAIRIRAPEQGELPTKKKPAPKPPVHDDMDDAIPNF
jgi:hypothetical protein